MNKKLLNKEFTYDIQKLFLEIIMENSEAFVRVQNIFNPMNFHSELRSVAQFIKDHTTKHKVLPERKQLTANTGVELESINDLEEGHIDWFLEEFEDFTKQKELERAVLKSSDLLEEREFGQILEVIKKASQIGLTKDLGISYFENPMERLMRLKNNKGQVSTGMVSLDKKLYGGFNRGELQIFAGGSGAGKSLFLQNLALNWVLMGMNGAFVTLELDPDLCSMRLDSMLTGISTKEIFKDLDSVVMKVNIVSKKAGELTIKYLPAQSNINQIRAFIRELEIQKETKIDFLIIDYLDLLMPVSAKVSPNDLFVKDKYVSEEIRNLSKELNTLTVTASQLNRSAVEEIEYDHSHIAGGISKINTADNVIGIFTSRAMRERGRYQIQLMKTRSSSGVGQKIDLEFDIESLRIRDLSEEEAAQSQSTTNDILSKIKQTSHVNKDGAEEKPIKAEVQSTKLKNMLKDLKKDYGEDT